MDSPEACNKGRTGKAKWQPETTSSLRVGSASAIPNNAGSVEDACSSLLTDTRLPDSTMIKRNTKYGNFLVASREIQKGELICSEKVFLVAPFIPTNVQPQRLCLSCGKNTPASAICSKCNWSVCDIQCEQNRIHSENECQIFETAKLKQKDEKVEYQSIPILRALILREKNPSKWAQLTRLESHVKARNKSKTAKAYRNSTVHFIRDQCKLNEYDETVIDQVVGIILVNSFDCHRHEEIEERYISALFVKMSLLTHDCDPNAQLTIKHKKVDEKKEGTAADLSSREKSYDEDCHSESGIYAEVHALKTIPPGKAISIQYINISKSVRKRQWYLKNHFYFDCACAKCVKDLSFLRLY